MIALLKNPAAQLITFFLFFLVILNFSVVPAEHRAEFYSAATFGESTAKILGIERDIGHGPYSTRTQPNPEIGKF